MRIRSNRHPRRSPGARHRPDICANPRESFGAYSGRITREPELGLAPSSTCRVTPDALGDAVVFVIGLQGHGLQNGSITRALKPTC
jgi:hypothetical protein